MAVKIEKRVGIQTPADTVYEILENINAWPEWSPIHKAASGKLGFGAPVSFMEHYEGLGDWEINGFVADWSPLSHIHIGVPKKFYEGSLIRFYEMNILNDSACDFTIGAQFSGFLSEREGKRYRKYLREGFAKFAEALKARAEGAI
ncbi:SRPBCC domain-containing protein [Asticcacaulis sp. AND118]|uniref:SRPBCC domain-containing protein n=1 Tax=Asticcacaulis sp. AND118 TaxID=2840468 RepID=UPI001CFFA07F|nr:SRPBCC domain-containing protein [Asticcacaulis sp. AND118]UDF02927.1 SRPBCC domain-containing protein [Asticcacaulis sp. AND118]